MFNKPTIKPDPNCTKCSGSGVLRTSDRKQKTCVCVCKSHIQNILWKFPGVKFKDPKLLKKVKPLTYIQTEIGHFKHDLAGYLLVNYPTSFLYLTAQDLFSYKFESKEIRDLLEPELLVLDFVGVVPNKLIPLFINQIIEERSIYEGRQTWIISKYVREDLLRHLGFKEYNEESNIAVLRETLDKFYILGRISTKEPEKIKSTKQQNILGSVRIGI